MSDLFRARRPATKPEADAAFPAKVVLRAGTMTEVVGYNPCRTHRQLGGIPTIVFSRSALRMYRYARESPHPWQARFPGRMYSFSLILKMVSCISQSCPIHCQGSRKVFAKELKTIPTDTVGIKIYLVWFRLSRVRDFVLPFTPGLIPKP